LEAFGIGDKHVASISYLDVNADLVSKLGQRHVPAKWITTSGGPGIGPSLYPVILKWVVKALKTCPESVRSVFKVKTSADGSGNATRSKFRTLWPFPRR
jgi:hypothetical protein